MECTVCHPQHLKFACDSKTLQKGVYKFSGSFSAPIKHATCVHGDEWKAIETGTASFLKQTQLPYIPAKYRSGHPTQLALDEALCVYLSSASCLLTS